MMLGHCRFHERKGTIMGLSEEAKSNGQRKVGAARHTGARERKRWEGQTEADGRMMCGGRRRGQIIAIVIGRL